MGWLSLSVFLAFQMFGTFVVRVKFLQSVSETDLGVDHILVGYTCFKRSMDVRYPVHTTPLVDLCGLWLRQKSVLFCDQCCIHCRVLVTRACIYWMLWTDLLGVCRRRLQALFKLVQIRPWSECFICSSSWHFWGVWCVLGLAGESHQLRKTELFSRNDFTSPSVMALPSNIKVGPRAKLHYSGDYWNKCEVAAK